MHVFVGHAVYISFCMASKCFLYCSSSLKVRKITTVLIIAIIKCFFLYHKQIHQIHFFFISFSSIYQIKQVSTSHTKKRQKKNSCFNLGRFVTKVARRLFLRLIIRLCTIWTFKERQVKPSEEFFSFIYQSSYDEITH